MSTVNNHGVLIGRITKDTVLNQGPNGPYAWMTVAVNERYKNKQGKWVETTEFIPLTVFEGMATACFNYCGKGSMIAVSIRHTYGEVTRKGVKRWEHGLRVEHVEFLECRTPAHKAAEEAAQEEPAY